MNSRCAFDVSAVVETMASSEILGATVQRELPRRRVLFAAFDHDSARIPWMRIIAGTEDEPEAVDTIRETLSLLLKESEDGRIPGLRVVMEDELLRLSQREANLHAPDDTYPDDANWPR
jgi:hypothetical protein